jgi:probable rRNA maturation factor
MSVSIRKFKTKIDFDAPALKKDAQKLLKLLGYGDFSLSILLTNNETIQEYNKIYREKDMPTDILSFAFHADLKPGEAIEICCDDEKELGDLVISLEYVEKDAKNWNETFEERMQTLLVHGICHLLGYDHELDEDYVIMNKEEKRLLSELGRYEK